MTSVAFEQHETRLGDGRRVAIWTVAPAAGPIHPLPIVVGAGFCRRMHHFAPVALYGAYNGFRVCRYDPVNHVGLSDGELWNFTLGDSCDSLRAAIDWTFERTGQRPAVVATSLTARMAYQVAAETDRVARVITAVGVVNVRATLARVFGKTPTPTTGGRSTAPRASCSARTSRSRRSSGRRTTGSIRRMSMRRSRIAPADRGAS
jgi:acyl transferase